MARPRTASNLLDLTGAFKKNPQRSRPDEPKPNTPFPKNPPSYFTAEQKQAWRVIVKAVPPGVLTGSDHLAVEVTARLLAEFRAGPMPTARITRLTSEMGKLGLTPSGRASLVVPKRKESGFDDV